MMMTLMTTLTFNSKERKRFKGAPLAPSMILGIDVGQKNLGACVVDAASNVRAWAVWDSAGSWAKDVYACLSRDATDAFLEGVSHVVIERQPSKNPTMVRISHYLEFFFVSKGFEVSFQDPKHKLLYAASTEWFPADSTDKEWTYWHRKQLAVKTTAAFVEATNQPLRSVFETSKKKDDLADALWHAMAFKNRQLPRRASPAKQKTRGVARKPTDRQRQSGKLSPSNITYYLRGMPDSDVPAALKADKALARALIRHFGDLEGFREADRTKS